MAYIEENNQRELFRKTIKEQLIGPGSDIFGFDPEHELISSSPRNCYYAGILFPPSFQSNREVVSDDEGKEEGDDDILLSPDSEDKDNYQEEDYKSPSKEEPQATLSNVFLTVFPAHCGLTFCVGNDTEKMKAEISLGTYSPLKERKIRATLAEYELIKGKIKEVEKIKDLVEMFGNDFLSTLLLYENDILSLKNQPPVYKYTENGKARQKQLLHTSFKKLCTEIFGPNQLELQKLLRLLGNIYERKPFHDSKELPVTDSKGFLIENELEYYIKSFADKKGDRKFVKIQIRNVKKSVARDYRDCFYQVKLRISNVNLLPYHEPIVSAIDEDFSIIEYQYQDEKAYGKGSICSAIWEKSENPSWIETSHLPEADIRSFSNNAREGDNNAEVLKLHNLSVWTKWDKTRYIENLENFVSAYREWIDDNQAALIEGEPAEIKKIGKALIDKQIKTAERLKKNIRFLNENDHALKCFKLANTAMLLQMIVARDEKFEKNRSLPDVESNAFLQYSDITFFETYSDFL